MQIRSLPTLFPDRTQGQSETRKAALPSFEDEFKSKIREVDNIQHEADKAMQDGAIKGAQRIDETMLKLEEADISLRLMVKVRSKALEAYQEVMRMQF